MRTFSNGVPHNIDAALPYPDHGTCADCRGDVYFFKGSKYYRYDFSERAVEHVGDIGVLGWKGVPTDVDAAFIYPMGGPCEGCRGDAYFFRGRQYYRYDFGLKNVEADGETGIEGWEEL